MKIQILIAALILSSAVAQNSGYSTGGTGSVTLPSSPPTSTNPTTPQVPIEIPTFPTADIFKLTQGGSTNPATTSENIVNTLNSAKKELSTPVRSMDSIFSRLPSRGELNKFADDGDIAAITKTLQVVASDDSIPCGTKIAYLLQLLGTVKAAIQRKTLLADQLQSIIDGARAEIKRLEDEIARIQSERDALGIPDIEARINDIVLRLQNLYNQINAVKAQIPPEEARIVGYQKELNTLVKQNDDERRRISNDKLKLVETDNLIKDLETKLQNARDNKRSLENSITASDNIIKDNNNKIANIRTTIAEIAAKIKSLQDTVDRLKREANQLEVDLERSRTDLSVARVKDDNFNNQIRDLQDRINQEKPKLVDTELKRLRTIIDNLNKILPTIQTQIDREYYYCYGAGKVEEVKAGNQTVFVVKGEAWTQYVQNAYGQSVGPVSPIATGNIRLNPDVTLNVVNPFSRTWTAKFGYPFAAGAGAAGSLDADFSCLGAAGAATSGMGVISGILNDGFTVSDASGRSTKLKVGSCSRIESTSELPKVGQQMAWRGAPSAVGGYNLYTGLCY